MAEPLLHDQTKRQLEQVLANPSHALVVTGPAGSGKGVVLDQLIMQLLDTDKPADHAGVLVIEREPEKNEISIDAVRKIQHFLTLKTTGTAAIRRVIRIEDAHLLSPEAQNALLKNIEEPPADTVLLLSTTSLRQLLPTVASRLQELSLTVPAADDIRQYFIGLGHPAEDVERALNMSGNLPGTTAALLNQAAEHPMNQAADWARKLLAANTYERLSLVDQLSKQRDLAANTCDMLGRMATVMLQKTNLTASQQMSWMTILRESSRAADSLRRYGNPKLVLSSLSLHL